MKKYFIPDNFFWRLLAGREGKRRFWSLVHNSPLHWWICLLAPPRGTRSILFGVHQFLWHPLTVAYAWRKLYGRWPKWTQWVAIFCHDLGYWGKPNMDGAQGKTHPVAGANLACDIVYYLGRLVYRDKDTAILISESTRELSLWHSTHYAQQEGGFVSELYLPDKACVLYEPAWFYLFRAWLSGELKEYVDNDNHNRWLTGESKQTSRQWLEGYRTRIQAKVDSHFQAEEAYRTHAAVELLHRVLGIPRICECEICTDKQDATALALHAIKK